MYQHEETPVEETLEAMIERLGKIDEALAQATEVWDLAAKEAEKAVRIAADARELYWTTRRLQAEAQGLLNWKTALQKEQSR